MITISPEVLSVTLRKRCFCTWKSWSGEFVKKSGLACNNKTTPLYATILQWLWKLYLIKIYLVSLFCNDWKVPQNAHKTSNNLCMFSTGIILSGRKVIHFCSSLTGWGLMHVQYFCACALIYLEQGMFMVVLLLTSQEHNPAKFCCQSVGKNNVNSNQSLPNFIPPAFFAPKGSRCQVMHIASSLLQKIQERDFPSPLSFSRMWPLPTLLFNLLQEIIFFFKVRKVYLTSSQLFG